VRQVQLDAVVRGERAEHVYDNVLRWEYYPELAPHVESTDRGLFGNFMKSFALPFEPVRQSGYLRLLDDLGIAHPKPVGHVGDPVPVGHVPAGRAAAGTPVASGSVAERAR
jgi:hypothetical protein